MHVPFILSFFLFVSLYRWVFRWIETNVERLWYYDAKRNRSLFDVQARLVLLAGKCETFTIVTGESHVTFRVDYFSSCDCLQLVGSDCLKNNVRERTIFKLFVRPRTMNFHWNSTESLDWTDRFLWSKWETQMSKTGFRRCNEIYSDFFFLVQKWTITRRIRTLKEDSFSW